MSFWQNLFGKKGKEAASEQEDTTHEEKRKYPRASTNQRTLLYRSNKPELPVKILDISQGGVKLEVIEALQIGSRVELALFSGDVETRAMLMIKWELNQAESNIYGAEFVSVDPKTRTIISNFIQSVSQ